MVHLPPLPGSPRGDATPEACLEHALEDARVLAQGGLPALLVENHGDAPFGAGRTPPHVAAFLALAVRLLAEETGLPVGVNCLRNDAATALGAAAMAGGAFIRVNVLLGVTATDQGLIEGCAERLLRYRRSLEADVAILADVDVKFGTPLYRPTLPDLVAALVERGGADGLIVTGPATGRPPEPQVIAAVRAAAPADVAVLAGSGVTAGNLRALATHAEGAIVGTGLKHGGQVEARVDPERVAELVRIATARRQAHGQSDGES
jgi:membrane complex biogenesis BtpA family protein